MLRSRLQKKAKQADPGLIMALFIIPDGNGLIKRKEYWKMKNSAVGRNWKEVRAALFTPEEIMESDLRVALIGALIKAPQEKEISQKQPDELSQDKHPLTFLHNQQ